MVLNFTVVFYVEFPEGVAAIREKTVVPWFSSVLLRRLISTEEANFYGGG